MSRIMLACGGTGGHLAPGIALAKKFADLGHTCLLLISNKKVDSQMLEQYPELTFERLEGRGFGPDIIGRLLFFPSLIGSILSSRRLIRRFKPDVLVCFGGFISLGPAMACRIARIPIVVHEANRRPGKAVKFIARFATSVHLPKGVRLSSVPENRQHDSGYPVRTEIAPQNRDKSRRALGFRTEGRLLLVIGGSQGAMDLNRWVMEFSSVFLERGINVLCLTGPNGSNHTIKLSDVVIKFMPFCHQMSMAYSAADLVVARSGAGTLAELAKCRTPSVLVPLLHAADNHQTANAEYFAEAGGAWVLAEDGMARLAELIFNGLQNKAALKSMRNALAIVDEANNWENLVTETLAIAAHSGNVET